MQQLHPDAGLTADHGASRAKRRRFWVVTAAALALTLLTARLGLWQLDRAAQKLALQAEREQAAARPPVSPHEVLAAPQADWQQRSVRWTGRWRPEHSVWLDNRPMHQRSGFVLLTPLQLSNSGALVWVQRGWQAKGAGRHEAPPWPASPSGEVTVAGRLAAQASRAYDLGPAASGPLKQNLDLAASAAALGQPPLPWVLWQTEACAPLACDWPAPDDGVAKHHGYAAQWFALSALTLGLYVWFQLILPRRRQRARA